MLEKGTQYHNPDLLVRLTTETNIIEDGVSCKGFVHSGAQISTITKCFAKAFRLKNYRWVTGYREDRRNRSTT